MEIEDPKELVLLYIKMFHGKLLAQSRMLIQVHESWLYGYYLKTDNIEMLEYL